MPIDNRPEVVDYVAWGQLVKKWAKGEMSLPTTLAEMLAECAAANVGMMMPPYINDLHVVQKPKETFVLRLPPGDLIAQSEQALSNGGLYPIPRFYNDRYDKILKVPQDEMLNFHSQRTGDYVIRLCI